MMMKKINIITIFIIYFILELIISYVFILDKGLGTFLVMNYLMIILIVAFCRLKKNKNEANKRLVETLLIAAILGLLMSFMVSMPTYNDIIILILVYFLPLGSLLYFVKTNY